MSILFFIPIISDDDTSLRHWDGHNIRFEGVGVSGTHNCTTVVAEQIASKPMFKHVYIANKCTNKIVNSVKYINIEEINDIKNEIHTLVLTSFFMGHPQCNQLLTQFNNLKHLVIWFHCADFNVQEQLNMSYFMKSSPKTIVSYVHLSQWSKSIAHMSYNCEEGANIFNIQLYPNIYFNDIIQNPIDDSNYVIPSVSKVSMDKDTNFVQICHFRRGGAVTLKVIELLRSRRENYWGSLFSASYRNRYDEQADKKKVYDYLSQSRYFIYPLIDQNNAVVHRDTFGCCVAEALAMGVEVITYPFGALKEHFGDMLYYIPVPDQLITEVNRTIMNPMVPYLLLDQHIDSIVDFIIEHDKGYAARAQQRYRNMVRTRSLFSASSIGSRWAMLLSKSNPFIEP